MKETIICSAIFINNGKEHNGQPTNIKTGYIISGRRHHNCYATLAAIMGGTEEMLSSNILSNANHSNKDQGFVTSLNRYVDRKEGFVIAKRENQLLAPSLHDHEGEHILTSEDLFPCDWESFKY